MRSRAGSRFGLGFVAACIALAAVPSANARPSVIPFPRNGTLVFACGGCPGDLSGTRLYTIGSDGRGLRRLRNGANLYEPRWSPNGRLLAVSAGLRSIWLLAANGSSVRRLTDIPASRGIYDESPSWSPDGRRLVFVRLTEGRPPYGASNRTALWVVQSTGPARPTPLVRPEGDPDRTNVVSPEFSRSGRSIAYGDVSERLWQARSDGTRPRRLGPAGITGRDPRWSPDDERVAFLDVSSGPRLRLLRVRSNRVTTLRADEATADRAFAWSPDGHWLAVARSAVYQCDPLHQCEDFELWIVNADDRRARRIYRAPGGIVYGLDWRPPAP